MSQGFFKVPRSLLSNPQWQQLNPKQQYIFFKLLELACYKPQTFSDNGILIELQPGQLCITVRELANLCHKSIDKNAVERALKKFQKVFFSRQEVRHTKTIITITVPGIYEEENLTSETAFETKVRQERDIKEESKKEKKEKEDIYISHKIFPIGPFEIENPLDIFDDDANQKPEIKNIEKDPQSNLSQEDKIKFGEYVWFNKNSGEYEKLCSEYGKEIIHHFIDAINLSDKANSYKDYSKAIRKWILNSISWGTFDNLKKSFTSKKENVKDDFDENIVEISEERKLKTKETVKKNWDKFKPGFKPDIHVEYVQIGNDRIYFKERHFEKLFKHSMIKAIMDPAIGIA